jgi:hypothetical protein
VKSMSRIWVLLEQGPKVEWFCWGQICWVLEETVLKGGSSEGAHLGNRLLLPVVLLFRQWRRKWGMMFLCLPTEGF